MTVREVAIGAVLVLACLARQAVAQNTMPNLPQFGGGPEVRDRGAEPRPQSNLLSIAATKPMVLRAGANGGSFRIVLRVTSTSGNVPFVTIGYGGFRSDYVLDWRAFSSNGARCNLNRENLSGVDTFSGPTIGAGESIAALQQRSGAGSVASSTRATLVSADFDCDGPVRAGDTMSIQIKFYALTGSGWRTATYSFDELRVS